MSERKCPHCQKVLFGDDSKCWFCDKEVGTPAKEKDSSVGSSPFENEDSSPFNKEPDYSMEQKHEQEDPFASLPSPSESVGKKEKIKQKPKLQVQEIPKPKIIPAPSLANFKREQYTVKPPVAPPPKSTPKKTSSSFIFLFIVTMIIPGIVVFISNKNRSSRKAKRAKRTKRSKKYYKERSSKYRNKLEKDRLLKIKAKQNLLAKKRLAKQNSNTKITKNTTLETILGDKCFAKKDPKSCEDYAYAALKLIGKNSQPTKKITRAHKIACLGKRRNSCYYLCTNVTPSDSNALSNMEHRKYCSLSCDKHNSAASCNILAFMEVSGKNGKEDFDSARRHISGQCNQENGNYCWNEGEVEEIIAWKTLLNKNIKTVDDTLIWYGFTNTKRNKKTINKQFRKYKQRVAHHLDKGIRNSYYKPASNLKKLRFTSKSYGTGQFIRSNIWFKNGSCKPATMTISTYYRLKKVHKTVFSKKSCFKSGKDKKPCQLLVKKENKNPKITRTITLKPNESKLVVFELDSALVSKDPITISNVHYEVDEIIWPKDKKCAPINKNNLMRLTGTYKYLKTIYSKVCKNNKKPKPNSIVCSYLKGIGKHKLKTLVTLCNNRSNSFLDGACYRLKDKYKLDVFKMNATNKNQKALISKLMEKHNPLVNRCYEMALKRDKTIKGTLKVILNIGNKGKVTSCITTGITNKNKIGKCVCRKLKKMKFPSLTGINKFITHSWKLKPLK
jgi:hypothetical protein